MRSAHGGHGRLAVPKPTNLPKVRRAHHDSTLRAARVGIHPRPWLLLRSRSAPRRGGTDMAGRPLLGMWSQPSRLRPTVAALATVGAIKVAPATASNELSPSAV